VTLSEKQQEFAVHVSLLIQEINRRGYRCTFGDAYRSPKAFGGQGEPGPYGRAKSAHKNRLAVDLNLFSPDGKYLTESEDHRPFAEYWKTLHPDNRAGADFNPPDGNHYSRRHEGIA